jgi:hypothetical protein
VRLLGRCNKSHAKDIGPLRNVDEVICIGFDVIFDFSSFMFQHGCGVVYSLYVHEQLRPSGMLCQLGSSENCRTKGKLFHPDCSALPPSCFSKSYHLLPLESSGISWIIEQNIRILQGDREIEWLHGSRLVIQECTIILRLSQVKTIARSTK